MVVQRLVERVADGIELESCGGGVDLESEGDLRCCCC
jgi:hypothetical protein